MVFIFIRIERYLIIWSLNGLGNGNRINRQQSNRFVEKIFMIQNGKVFGLIYYYNVGTFIFILLDITDFYQSKYYGLGKIIMITDYGITNNEDNENEYLINMV